MFPTAYRIVRHPIGFWDSTWMGRVDAIAEGSRNPFAFIDGVFTGQRAIWIDKVTVSLYDEDGAVRESYRYDKSTPAIAFSGVDHCHAVFGDHLSNSSYCYLAYPDGNEIATLKTPLALKISREAFYEIHLHQPRMKLAEVHRAWRDSEKAAGTIVTVQIAPDLDEEPHRLAIVTSLIVAAEHSMP